MGVLSYRNLQAWQMAMNLVEEVYLATQTWPKDELYGLTSQIRRAAVSVPANIAEGQGRRGSAEMLHHLSIAHGSLMELETHLLIAVRLGYQTQQGCEELLARSGEAGRLLNGLMRSMR